KLIPAIRDVERHHSVDTSQCEEQRGRGKTGEQPISQSGRHERTIYRALDRAYIREWQFRIELRDFLSHIPHDARRIDARAHHQHRLPSNPLAVRPVDIRPRVFVELAVFDARHDSDNGHPWTIADADPSAGKISVGRVPAR